VHERLVGGFLRKLRSAKLQKEVVLCKAHAQGGGLNRTIDTLLCSWKGAVAKEQELQARLTFVDLTLSGGEYSLKRMPFIEWTSVDVRFALLGEEPFSMAALGAWCHFAEDDFVHMLTRGCQGDGRDVRVSIEAWAVRFLCFDKIAASGDAPLFSVLVDAANLTTQRSHGNSADDFLARGPAAKKAKTSEYVEGSLEAWLEEVIENDHELSLFAHVDVSGDGSAADSDAAESDGEPVDCEDACPEDADVDEDAPEGAAIETEPGHVEPPEAPEAPIPHWLEYRAAAFVTFRPLRVEEVLASCSGISEAMSTTKFRIRDAESSEVLGVGHCTFGGSAYEIKCSQNHGRCKLILSQKLTLGIDILQVKADAVLWLLAGSRLNENDHWALGFKLRRDTYLMKVKT
jgi:hypothetical protein